MSLKDYIQDEHYRVIDSLTNSIMDFKIGIGVERIIFVDCGLSPLTLNKSTRL